MDLKSFMKHIFNNNSIEEELFNLGLNWEDNNIPQTVLVNTSLNKNSSGLILFGLMCRDLCSPEKNNKAKHFNELIINAKEYINKCKGCNFSCKPDVAECGRTSKATNELKNIKDSRVYRVESVTSNESKQSICVSYSKKATKHTPFPTNAYRYIQQDYSEEWHCKGESQLFCNDESSLSAELYSKFTSGEIFTDNLAFSYSGLVYVGSNKKESERNANSLTLKVNDKTYPLSDLLTFSNSTISRLRYISALTLKGLDKHKKARTVVFEDIYSFKLIDHSVFHNSTKFIIVNTEESDQKLESLYEYYSTNRQWFSINEELTESKNTHLSTRELSVLVLSEV
jgi:hypothetical protein